MLKTNLIAYFIVLIFFQMIACTTKTPIIQNQSYSQEIKQSKAETASVKPKEAKKKVDFKLSSFDLIAIKDTKFNFLVHLESDAPIAMISEIIVQSYIGEQLIADQPIDVKTIIKNNNKFRFQFLIDDLKNKINHQSIELKNKVLLIYQDQQFELTDQIEIKAPKIQFQKLVNNPLFDEKSRFVFQYLFENPYPFELELDSIELHILNQTYSKQFTAQLAKNQSIKIDIPVDVNILDFYNNGIEFFHQLPIQFDVQLNINNAIYDIKLAEQITIEFHSQDQALNLVQGE